MDGLLKSFFAIILGTLLQTSTIVTFAVAIVLLMVYLYFKKDIKFLSRKVHN